MKKLRILFSVLAILILMAPASYGKQLSFGDGQIEADVLDSWELITEEESSEELLDAFGWSKEEAFDQMSEQHIVLLGQRRSGKQTERLEIRYGYDDEYREDYKDYTEDELEEYGQTYYLEQILSGAVTGMETFGSESWDDPEVIETSWSSFVCSRGAVANGGTTTYYAVYDTVVEGTQASLIFSSQDADFSSSQKKEMDSIVSSYYDDGYYTAVWDDSEYDYDDEYDDDENYDSYEIGTAVPWIIVFIWFIAFLGLVLFKKASTEGKSVTGFVKEKAAGHDLSSITGNAIFAKKDRKKGAEKQAGSSTARRKNFAGENTFREAEYRTGSAGASDESYLKSLKTLLDSGLLTRAEYQEMVEKHRSRRS